MITQPRATIWAPELAYPGETIDIKLEGYWLKDVEITLYRMKESHTRRYGRVERSDLDKIDSRNITYMERLPEVSDSVTFKAPNDGIYYVELQVDGNNDGSFARMNVTTYVPFLIGQKGRYALAVINAAEGKPMKGGTVYINNEKKAPVKVATTDGDGLALFEMPSVNYRDNVGYISVVKGKNTYDFGREVDIYSNYSRPGTNNEVNARFFTDRPVYHPGDTVGWSLVLGYYNDDSRRGTVCNDARITVALYDVNYRKVDSVQVVTDAVGRASGKFVIPTDRLAGTYHLNLEETPLQGRFPVSQYSSVMVSDFKMPQFEIKDFSATVLPDGSISVSGDAVTFSGMPVIDAAVSVSLKPQPIWRYLGEYSIDRDVKSATLTGTTDSSGHFTLVADTTQITKRINYNISATVTDKAAEIATASDMVRADNRLFFSYIGNRVLNVDNGFIKGLCIVDATSSPVNETAQWQLLKSGKIVADGICSMNDNGASIDLSSVPAGRYKLALRQDNNKRLQPDTIEITTYSIKRNRVPSELPLLLPDHIVSAPAHGRGSILAGVPSKTAIYVFTYSASTLVSAEYRELGPGFHKIATPEGAPDARYSVCIARVEGKKFVTDGTVEVICDNPDALKMTVESWRDNLLPGSGETITMKITAESGEPVNAGVIATLYNAALDKLLPSFKNNFCARGSIFPQFNFYRMPSLSALMTLRDYKDIATYRASSRYNGKIFNIDIPSFRYLYQYQTVYYKAAMPMLTSSARGVNDMNDLVLCEDVVEECEMEAAPVAGYAAASSADTMAADTEGGDAGEKISEPELRMGEIMQAFWRPLLVSGEDGSLIITYTVPNANGTWRFLASAWNDALYATSIDRSAISSKPIMVQPAVPRFLRRGDTATLEATIYNKTSEPADVNYIIEIFEPSTGKVIQRSNSTCHIDAMGSALVQIDGVGTSDVETIGYRVKASTDVYSDGEQNLIPILDSGMTVFDSSTFYLTDSNPTFITSVPDAEGARNVLDYCGNPVWDVVKALPALYDRNPRTGFAAVRAVYGALTARGLARKFPEINRAINIWQENPADSALVSDLYKNESIKNLMLQQTPWEWAAADNTSRMERLSLTFNPSEIKSVLDRGIAALESLQRPDGGFAWGSWSTRSDLYTTESILSVLGRLAQQGFIEGNPRLDTMIDSAFHYVDTKVKPGDSRYAYIVTLYPGRVPTSDNARAALNYGVSQALSTWKRAGNVSKASMALMLKATGHEKEAREIISSIRQFEVKSPLAGISFPSVDAIDGYSVILRAFATIDPRAQELDAMRQWLVLRSQSTDDLGSWDPTSLISAILSTGSHWTTLRAAQAPVSLGGRLLPISNAESVTGSFSVVLPSDAAGSSIEITRPGGSGVSYGSLTSIYTAPMETVEARSSDAVEVTKRFLVADGDSWRETTTFSHGERVKVQITLRVKREMEYLTVVDDRPAAFEPVEQMPGYVYADGLR
ncbi:MAG: hypothetical protein K2M00_06845, partial [Muribaculaceae bacterium]|nr:hypothetical protein [Muribaculaceae bacterium]